jgi:hypothetical protein
MLLYRHVPPEPAAKVARGHAIVFGINPGAGGGGSAPAWLNKCAELTHGICETFTLAELIEESSHDLRAFSDDALDALVRANAAENLALIAKQKPCVIFQAGLRCERVAREAYGLSGPGHRVARPRGSGALLIPYRLGATPWITMMHLSSKGYGHADGRAANEFAWKILHPVKAGAEGALSSSAYGRLPSA